MDADGGVIEVSFTSVDIKEPVTTQFLDLAPGSYLKLTVSDTGNGMTPEVMEKIFDPYFTTKEKGKGTGLGLAVVHGILKRHRAAITVEATPAKGSTFHVYFPRIKQAATPAKAGAAEPLPGGHECVLIVDDEEDLVTVETRLLSRLGYEVVSQNNSIEVLELFQAQPDRFDVVITDMTMPKMTGDKLAKEILKIRPDLPIILCTGYSEHLSEEQAKKIGIKEYCLKPVRMRDLARTMRKVLDQNQC
jgi:CheY-like chemotaxis protein